jgi:hypothetical protein
MYPSIVKDAPTFQVAIRIPSSWLSDADGAADKLSKSGRRATRTEAMRMAMSVGLRTILADLKFEYGERERKTMYSAAELFEEEPPVLDLGGWRFRQETLELAYSDESGHEIYAVDLERLKSSAPTLDVVMQLAGKSWLNSAELGFFVRMLSLTIDPQASMCSFGRDRNVDPKKALAKNGYLARPRAKSKLLPAKRPAKKK